MLTEYLMGMAVNILLTTIALCIKDPAKAAQYKKMLCKIRNQINLLYPEE
jgi:hypothetical protein